MHGKSRSLPLQPTQFHRLSHRHFSPQRSYLPLLALFPPASPGPFSSFTSRDPCNLFPLDAPGSLHPFLPSPFPPTLGKLAPLVDASGSKATAGLRGSPAAEMRSYLEKLRDLPPGQVIFGVAAAHAAWRRKGDGARLGLLGWRFRARLFLGSCPSLFAPALRSLSLAKPLALVRRGDQREAAAAAAAAPPLPRPSCLYPPSPTRAPPVKLGLLGVGGSGWLLWKGAGEGGDWLQIARSRFSVHTYTQAPARGAP